MKTITLKQKGWQVSGEVLLRTRGCGTEGVHPMNSYFFKTLTKEKLLSAINDGGYGFVDILEARVYIHEVYEGGFSKFRKMLNINSPKRLAYAQIGV